MHNRSLAIALLGAVALGGGGGAAFHIGQTAQIPDNVVAARDPVTRGAVARRGTRGSRRIAAHKRMKNRLRNGS